ncbi:hypothetical protein BpHYR1_038219 [Brachionus plicatilis]|uniref:Uncharacterized protein n=1 Tax=Brachionus plicatilis TaxID=10195 RepID=A0A3M7SIK2_BRAPC|nr:hypothetical protein BpHYR1_038219 [Brachionus plicatilis]
MYPKLVPMNNTRWSLITMEFMIPKFMFLYVNLFSPLSVSQNLRPSFADMEAREKPSTNFRSFISSEMVIWCFGFQIVTFQIIISPFLEADAIRFLMMANAITEAVITAAMAPKINISPIIPRHMPATINDPTANLAIFS